MPAVAMRAVSARRRRCRAVAWRLAAAPRVIARKAPIATWASRERRTPTAARRGRMCRTRIAVRPARTHRLRAGTTHCVAPTAARHAHRQTGARQATRRHKGLAAAVVAARVQAWAAEAVVRAVAAVVVEAV